VTCASVSWWVVEHLAYPMDWVICSETQWVPELMTLTPFLARNLLSPSGFRVCHPNPRVSEHRGSGSGATWCVQVAFSFFLARHQEDFAHTLHTLKRGSDSSKPLGMTRHYKRRHPDSKRLPFNKDLVAAMDFRGAGRGLHTPCTHLGSRGPASRHGKHPLGVCNFPWRASKPATRSDWRQRAFGAHTRTP
jgi:hypothetical protein